ncbi:MAG: hypothetical protein CBC38_00465 [Gammaproteobacteria bacterium TMED78]|nr:MAG: hypothetical protein CBC38_00465 [Gammaproteobacteria bacterium TMED78]|tara:strand:- start:36174 stop:36566 length:393 start_codon:yes stop_codon:yes gene_type:complete
MLRNSILIFILFLLNFNLSNIALSHHGFAAYSQENITLTGIVTNFRFVNPHVQVYFDVINNDGAIDSWQGELTAPNKLSRGGWSKNTLLNGEVLNITGAIPRNGARSMRIRAISRENGESVNIGEILEDL